MVYGGSRGRLRYACNRAGEVNHSCRHQFEGESLDQLIGEQVLSARQPAALELSLAATDDVLRDHAALDQNWKQRLERTEHEAQRAERQYHAVKPENRLVARTLEKRWEDALQAVRELEEEYARFQRGQPRLPTAADKEHIRALARDLPALWHAPTTQPIEGFHPPYGSRGFWKKNVGQFIRKYLPDQPASLQKRTPLPPAATPSSPANKPSSPTEEWTPLALARRLGIGKTTIYRWIKAGWVHSRRVPNTRSFCICWANESELQRLTELSKTPRHWYDPPLPSRLTTPHLPPGFGSHQPTSQTDSP